MKFVVFGLTISSSWGNGHATLLRGLFRALVRRGHEIVFFERDVPYYAANRDLTAFEGIRLQLYSDWRAALEIARDELSGADIGMVTSYCFDGVAATDLVVESPTALRVFYDLDTPVTLSKIRAGETVGYIGPRGLRDFDLVLSYTGGAALDDLRTLLRAPLSIRRSRLFALLVPAPLVPLHHSPGGYFFGALAVATGPLRAFFDVFVLALLLAAYAAQMFRFRHVLSFPMSSSSERMTRDAWMKS
jgi:hypothetical protein